MTTPINNGSSLILSSTGDNMPKIGLGTWKLLPSSCATTVYEAIKSGYRLLDCACDYGNENAVGIGLSKAIKEGIVTRKEMFITSKLWCTFMDPRHVQEACTRSCLDLQCDYLNLYLIHFPITLQYVNPSVRYPPGWMYDDHSGIIESKVTLQSTWEAMEKVHIFEMF